MTEVHKVRKSFPEYFLGIAQAASERGDCSRRQVGCVIASKDNRVVSVGYNGTLPGKPGCLAGECPRATSSAAPGAAYDKTACIAIHAEMNAVAYANRDQMEGGTAYVSQEPCYMCRQVLQASGVVEAVWPDGSITFAR